MPKIAAAPFLALLLGLLAACQAVPAPRPGFTPQQIAVLQANGFVQNGDAWELGLLDRLLFQTESSAIGEAQASRLAQLSTALGQVGISGARVNGHTDSTGAAAFNRTLSQRRSEAVKGALVRGGMKAGAITAQGLGESDPIESNATADGRAQNRRVVIIITAEDAH